MVVALIMIPALFYLPGTLVLIAPFLIREIPQFYGGSTDNDPTLVLSSFEKFNEKFYVRNTGSDCALSYPRNATILWW